MGKAMEQMAPRAALGAARVLALLSVALAVPLRAPDAVAGDLPEQPPPISIHGSERPMPAVGFGTCCREADNGPALIKSIEAYLALGGRLIDTAQLFDNHRDIAQAIRNSGLPREDIWVTSKLNVLALSSEFDVEKAVDTSLSELDMPSIDLMLLHGGGGGGFAIHPLKGEILWRGLIAARIAGKVRNIGVSNHNQQEIEHLTFATGEAPAVNQLEYHPWVPAGTKALVQWCQREGITVTAYNSLGGQKNKARGAEVTAIAKRYGVSNAQVLLRWALDQGVAVIPGATSESHIREDLDMAGVHIAKEDLEFLEHSAEPDDFKNWHNLME